MSKILQTFAYSHKRDLKCEGEDQLYSVRDLYWMLTRVINEGVEKLSAWEAKFLKDINRQILQGDTYFSPRQVKIVNKIYAEKTAL